MPHYGERILGERTIREMGWLKRKIFGEPQERYARRDWRTTKVDHEYFERVAGLVLPMVKGPLVLDLGCGQGWLTVRMADLPGVKHVDGIDRYEGWQVEHPKVRYFIDTLPARATGYWIYNTVMATDFLEHLTKDDCRKLCRQISEELRGAEFVGATPWKTKPTTCAFHLHEYVPEELESLFLETFFQVKVWTENDLILFRCSTGH